MAAKRIFNVRINLDDLGAELDTLYTAQERSEWLLGFRSGSRGAPPPAKATEALMLGFKFGQRAHAEALEFQAQRSVAGQASAQRRANGNTNGSSTDVERRHQRMLNGDINETTNGEGNHPTAFIQQPSSNQPSQPSAAPPPDDDDDESDDPRLVAIAAAGGYLTFQGEDFTGRWLADLGDDTVERIGEVMDWGRRRTGKPVRLPAYYCEHRKTMLDHRREQAARERQRAEADAHKAQEAERNSRRAQEAAAAQAEARTFVAALLAVYREDQDGWAARMSTDQAEVVAKLRDLYDGNRAISLTLMHLRPRLPAALLEAAQARAADAPGEVAP